MAIEYHCGHRLSVWRLTVGVAIDCLLHASILANLSINPQVPEGKGVSSSAAVEVRRIRHDAERRCNDVLDNLNCVNGHIDDLIAARAKKRGR